MTINRTAALLTLILSLSAMFGDLAVAQTSPDRVILKNVPYIKQKGSYCAPASASMVLKYYGANIDQSRLANLASNSSVNHQGTNMTDLSDAVSKMGYGNNLIWGPQTNEKKSKPKCQKAFYKGAIPEMNKYVAADIPPLLIIKKPGWNSSHLVVIVGYDHGSKTVFYMDPAIKRSKIHKISYKNLATYATLEYNNGYYYMYMVIEPHSEKRYKKNRKKKDLRSNSVSSHFVSEVLSYLIFEQKKSLSENSLMENNIYPSGYFTYPNSKTKTTSRINYENIDMLRPEMATSRSKSKQFAKKHSIKAIESNLLNNNVVAILFAGSVDESDQKANGIQQYMDKQNGKKANTYTESRFILLTGYNKTKREFTAYTAQENNPYAYTQTTLTYAEVLPKLNSKRKYINHKGKEKTKYTQQVVTFFAETA